MQAHLDKETYSPIDLKKDGLARYAAHPDADCLVVCYAFDDGPVKRWLPGDSPPVELFEADTFHAFNAQFERVIWHTIMRRRYGWPELPPLDRWRCTQALGQSFGLPASLHEQSRALRLPQQKDSRGQALIRYWCIPNRKTGERRWPFEDPPEFEALCDYCAQDVITERGMMAALPKPVLPPKGQLAWEHQTRVNERGIYLDVPTTRVIADAVDKHAAVLTAEANQLTGGLNPTQRAATLKWLRSEGVELENMRALTIKRALKALPESNNRRVLEIRSAVSKSSTAKYRVMLRQVSEGSRLHYTQRFHGASTGRVTHTGGVQLGNMARGEIKDAAGLAEQVGLIADPEALALFHDPMQAYSAMVRPMLTASPGNRLYSGDFAQVEARYNAWRAGQHDLVKMFADDIDVYKHMASRIYKMPQDRITKDSRERFIGKQTTLAAGFGVGPSGFKTRCKDTWDVDITIEEAEQAIYSYRDQVPRITAGWYATSNAAQNAVNDPGNAYPTGCGEVYCCSRNKQWLFCKLPSGRLLSYLRPRIEMGDYGQQLFCAGVDTYTKKWSESIKLWHGTLVENNVQAACYDIMEDAALRLEAAGFKVVLSVHDEIVSDASPLLEEWAFEEIMRQPVSWAPGLPIKVETWTGMRYRKG